MGTDPSRTAFSQYFDLWTDEVFQKTYRQDRDRLYRRVAQEAVSLDARYILEIGCAYGQIVELCNQAGREAWGLDLRIDHLVQHHSSLYSSRGRFLYGEFGHAGTMEELSQLPPLDLVICLDTARYFPDLNSLRSLKAERYLIKEVCSNRARLRKVSSQNDTKLYSPEDLCNIFEEYAVEAVFLPKFLLKFSYPSRFILRSIDRFMPTYVIIFKRRHCP